ncbi:MAG: RDD family protein [Sphingobacteriales bacterium]|nr:MAG: RDD family protein [Sphingobacteriales bacterium]
MDTEKYRTGLKRLWAAIVDGIVFLPFLLVEQWIYKTTSNISMLFAWATFFAFAPLIYSVVLHYKYGQTIGKWVAAVKVLDISETRMLTFRQAIFRDIFYLLVAITGFVYYAVLLRQTDDQQSVLADYSRFSDNPVFWWTLIELITMLTNSKRRAVHDFIAKSVVVRTETSS